MTVVHCDKEQLTVLFYYTASLSGKTGYVKLGDADTWRIDSTNKTLTC